MREALLERLTSGQAPPLVSRPDGRAVTLALLAEDRSLIHHLDEVSDW